MDVGDSWTAVVCLQQRGGAQMFPQWPEVASQGKTAEELTERVRKAENVGEYLWDDFSSNNTKPGN